MSRSDDVLAALYALHEEVDAAAAEVAQRNGARLQCRKGCATCCTDGLSVFEVEAERIMAHHGELLVKERPHPPGRCAFLGMDEACRIYPDRPYVCRTQGLPLAWYETMPQGELVQLRDICPINEEGPPLESIPDEDCWHLGPFEGRLRQLEDRASGGDGRRRPLRSLFRRA